MVDRNGNRITPEGIPMGRIDAAPTAARHADGTFKDAKAQEEILRAALLRAGVELGEHDDRIVRWLADFADWSTFATVTSWIERARAEDTTPGVKLPPVGFDMYRVHAESYVADYDPDDDVTPYRVWHITERAVTEVSRERWTPRLLALINSYRAD